ncbi:MAG: hypothetical protein ACP5PK_07010 [candidate division WOR-3 bacterium]
MLNLLCLLFSLFYQPDLWRHYPAMDQIGSITFSNRQIYIAVPDGIYILDLLSHRHLRTITAADGITDKIRFCAFSPSTRELLIAGTENLYQFIPATGRVNPLHPPFSRIRSIAIAANGAFFETELGLFRKTGPNDRYQPGASIAEPVRWYGEKDTISLRNWTFLTPYYIMDEQLTPKPLTRAYPEERTGRLYVTCPGYGVIIYNLRSGIRIGELRPGPTAAEVSTIIPAGTNRWFFTRTGTLLLDSTGSWHHFPDRSGELSFNRITSLLPPALAELNRQEPIRTLHQFRNRTYIGTDYNLYILDSTGTLEPLLHLNRPVNAIAQVRDSLLIGTDNGLLLLADDTLTPVTDPYARFDFGVYSIARTAEAAFFGTIGRILMLDQNNTWSQLLPPGFDLAQPVRTLTAAQNLLFVADRSGIYILNIKTGTWTTLDRTNGLAALPVTALYADERYLWIAAPGIISRYEYAKQLR